MKPGKIQQMGGVRFNWEDKSYHYPDPDTLVHMTRADGQPAKVPAHNVINALTQKGFKLGYPPKKKPAPKAAAK